jgi:DNA-binding response OmpR family regulator
MRRNQKGKAMASRFHVLVVEDEPLVQDAIQETLADTYLVSSAQSVQEAQAILRTSHIDVALIDRVLPGGRGAEVAILAEEVGATVIEMTGYPEEHVGLDAGERPHLFKPFGLNALLSAVGNALHDHQ